MQYHNGHRMSGKFKDVTKKIKSGNYIPLKYKTPMDGHVLLYTNIKVEKIIIPGDIG